MTAFRMISYIAVATNIALLGVDQDPVKPGYQSAFSLMGKNTGFTFDTELAFIALFFVEHGLVAMKSWISFLLPPRGGLLSKAFKQAPKERHVGIKDSTFKPFNPSGDGNLNVNSIPNKASLLLEKTVLEMFEKEDVSSTARKKFEKLLRHYKDEVTRAKRMREEAIAWAAEIVPASAISSHFEAIKRKEKLI